jgi:hypothetical protein
MMSRDNFPEVGYYLLSGQQGGLLRDFADGPLRLIYAPQSETRTHRGHGGEGIADMTLPDHGNLWEMAPQAGLEPASSNYALSD